MIARVPASHIIAYDAFDDRIIMVWEGDKKRFMQGQPLNKVRTYSPLDFWLDYFRTGGLVILESQ